MPSSERGSELRDRTSEPSGYIPGIPERADMPDFPQGLPYRVAHPPPLGRRPNPIYVAPTAPPTLIPQSHVYWQPPQFQPFAYSPPGPVHYSPAHQPAPPYPFSYSQGAYPPPSQQYPPIPFPLPAYTHPTHQPPYSAPQYPPTPFQFQPPHQAPTQTYPSHPFQPSHQAASHSQPLYPSQPPYRAPAYSVPPQSTSSQHQAFAPLASTFPPTHAQPPPSAATPHEFAPSYVPPSLPLPTVDRLQLARDASVATPVITEADSGSSSHFESAWRTAGIKQMGIMRHSSDRAGEVRVEISWDELPFFMDSMAHDYKVKRHVCRKSVRVNWLSPATGTSPGNLAGRDFELDLEPNAPELDQPDAVIWRSTGNCNGACGWCPTSTFGYIKSADEQMIELALSGYPSATAADWELTKKKKKKKKKKEAKGQESQVSCQIRIAILITVKQLKSRTLTVVYTPSGELHNPAQPGSLRPSQYLRNQLHQVCLDPGTTVSTLQRVFDRQVKTQGFYANRLKQAEETTHNSPCRLPNLRSLAAMVQYAASSKLIHRSTMAALEIIAARCPTSFIKTHFVPILQRPLPPETPNSADFYAIMGTPHTLEQAMIHTILRGIFIDSSSRKKNAYGAPLTLAVTLNEFHRMVPLFAMVSVRTTKAQYAIFFDEFTKALEAHAVKVLRKDYKFTVPGAAYRKEVMDAARMIMSKGYKPKFVMIDQSAAERGAAEFIWSGVTVRVCQFHLMQGIKRWLNRRITGKGDVAKQTKKLILRAIRHLQRCPDSNPDTWDTHWKQFQSDLAQVAADHPSVVSDMPGYLNRSWFEASWRETVCDYGLGTGTRDGPWSTNNFCEAAFRTFDRIILCMRVNKRMDTLIHLIINEYFPLYENFPREDLRPDPALLKNFTIAHDLWRRNLVTTPLAGDVHQTILDIFATAYTVRTDSTPLSPRYISGYLHSGKEACSCSGYKETGKRCSHLWAIRTVQTLGTVREFETNMGMITSVLSGKNGDMGEGDQDKDEEDDDEEEEGEDEDLGGTLGDDQEFWGYDMEHDPLWKYEVWDVRDPSRLPISTKGWERAGNTLDAASDTDTTLAPNTETPHDPAPTAQTKSRKSAPGAKSGPELRGRPPRQRPLAGRWTNSAKNKVPATSIPYPLPPSTSNLLLPTGNVNTGADCFWLAPMQILMRDTIWVRRFEATHLLPAVQGGGDAVKGLFGLIAACLRNFRAERKGAYSGIVQIVKDNQLVSNSAHIQQDSAEVVLKLQDRLDEFADPTTSFGSLLQRGMSSSNRCQNCLHSFDSVDHTTCMFMLYPTAARSLSSNQQTSVKDLLGESIAEHVSANRPTCPNCDSTRTTTLPNRTIMSDPPQRIYGQVMWPPTSITSKTLLKPSVPDPRFDIPSSFEAYDQSWHLSGVICHNGPSANSGHYTVIVPHGGKGAFYSINDDKAFGPVLLSAAFDHGQAPVLVVYRRGDQEDQEDGVKTGDVVGGRRGERESDEACPTQRPSTPATTQDLISVPHPPSSTLDAIYRGLPLKSIRTKSAPNPLVRTFYRAFALSVAQDWPALSSVLANPNRRLGVSVAGAIMVDEKSTFLSHSRINKPQEKDKMLTSTTAWWSDHMLSECIRIGATVIATKRTPTAQLMDLFTRYDYLADQLVFGTSKKGEAPLYSAWGSGTEWRESQWVYPFMVRPMHFGLAWIIPRSKCLLVLDPMPNAEGNAASIEVWRTEVGARLIWDMGHGGVEDNISNWTFGTDARAVSDLFSFPIQSDTNNCGPLCAAAGIYIIQGLWPHHKTFGFAARQPTPTESSNLRSSLINMALAVGKHDVEKREGEGLSWASDPAVLSIWGEGKVPSYEVLTEKA